MLLLTALAVAGLAWAKWLPYLHKLQVTETTGAFPGHDLLRDAGKPGSAPSLGGALKFTKAYGIDILPALIAALVIAAGVETLLPRRWMLRAFGRDGMRGRVRAGLVALPCMMCTCCSAPVVYTLRRKGVPTGTVLSYWLGNPLLNPAVLALLAIVMPWQWVLTRILVGALLVFLLTGLVARLVEGRRREAQRVDGDPVREAGASTAEGGPPLVPSTRTAEAEAALARRENPPVADEQLTVRRFPIALLKLTAVLVPEYLIVVFAVGLLRGWLMPIGEGATHLAILITLAAAVLGTLVVIPTAGEIPLLAALATAGVSAGPLGALLITLPAVSLPSIAMVSRALGWRATGAMAVAVAACGMLSGALLWALGG